MDIDLEHDFYEPVKTLVCAHSGVDGDSVRKTLDDQWMFLATMPAHRAFAIITKLLGQAAKPESV